MKSWTVLVLDRKDARARQVRVPGWAPFVGAALLLALTALGAWVGFALPTAF